MDTARPPPLSAGIVLYVLHHERSEEGRRLARLIHRWFRRPSEEVWRGRCGVPVFVRSAPYDPAVHGLEERGTCVGAADQQIQVARGDLVLRGFAGAAEAGALALVVPLVDAHMATDRRWGRLVDTLLADWEGSEVLLTPERLGEAPSPTLARPYVQVIPVALDAYPSQVTPKLAPLQGISPAQWADPPDPDRARVLRDERIRRELYLTAIRTLRWLLERRPSEEPVHLFLSHAKRDGSAGAGVAEALRDVTSGLGHVRAWYDATDLLPGTDWRAGLRESAGVATAGLIACWSDSYASRPWCLEELRQARTPRPLGDSGVWAVQPTVVVDLTGHSQDWTGVPPELGGLPVIRGVPGTASAAPVDRVLFESFQTLANAVYARALLAAGQPRGTIAITWAPDPATMLALSRALGRSRPRRILHPGYDGRGGRGGASARLAPRGAVLARYDEFETTDEIQRRLRVQLSLGDPDDAEAIGLLPKHLDDVAYEVALTALGLGADLLYGGQPAEQRPGEPTQLTEEIAVAAMEFERPDQADGDDEPRERVLFTVPWAGSLPPAARTRWLPVCRVEHVLPPPALADMAAAIPAGDELDWLNAIEADRARAARHRAVALCAMRERAAKLADLVILAGGKGYGYSGLMPGLLEEFAAARKAKKAVVLLAGFGGAALRIARAIVHRDPGVDPWLSLKHHLGHRDNKLAALWEDLEQHGEADWGTERWVEARAQLLAARVASVPDAAGAHGVWRSTEGPRLVIAGTDSMRVVRRLVAAEIRGVGG